MKVYMKSDAEIKFYFYKGLQSVAIFSVLFDLIKPSKCKLSLTRRQHRVTHRDRFLKEDYTWHFE